MKWYTAMFLIVIVVLSVLSVYRGLTPQTYNENGVYFKYPGTWNQLSAKDWDIKSNNTIAVVGDSNNAQNSSYITMVMVQKTNQSGTLDEIVAASKANLQKDKKAVMISDKNITVNGVKAHDVFYNVTMGGVKKEVRLVVLAQNNTVYSLTLSAPASDFANQKENFDMVVRSFKITGEQRNNYLENMFNDLL
ncbi:PsbP [anaerobic digester metagenome]